MRKYNWNRLSRLQIGRYAEYFVKKVYTAEVDDRGVDFVIRKDDRYYDVQVNCQPLLGKKRRPSGVILAKRYRLSLNFLIPSFEFFYSNGAF